MSVVNPPKMSDGDAAPGHVLVVEDQPYDRDLLARILRSAGHRISTAADGPSGISILQERHPDVVLCDVVMPGMDGLSFCRAVKLQPGGGFVPVLLVTGRTQPTDLLAGFAAGADDYIAKPINFDELKARVRTMLRIRRLHANLEGQAARLSRANRDMEEFLHAVSHDLRAPLISTIGLAGVLGRDHAATLGESGMLVLRRLQSNVASMAALVNHLVEFARLGNAPHRPRPTPLRPLVDQACANVNAAIEVSRARLEIASEWPTVTCDLIGVCQVLQNLVGNAAKFMGTQAQPRIEIGCAAESSECRVWVRDNGIGIPPERHSEVFRLFGRLGQIETDGLGVGLSTAEKIVLRHGGRIWIESELGIGTTVYFTLPRADDVP